MYSFGSPANRKKPKGRVIQAPKFYLFDTAIANHLLKRGTIEMGSELFSRSLLIAVIPDFAEEYKVKTLILVSTDPITRQMGNITALLNSMGVRWGFDGGSMGVRWEFDGSSMGVRWGMYSKYPQ